MRRQPGGEQAEEQGVCPVTEHRKLHGIHGGVNAGRACWIVAGTMCGGKAVGTLRRRWATAGSATSTPRSAAGQNDATIGFSGSLLGMQHAVDKLVHVDHLAQIVGIGRVRNIEALRNELKRASTLILGSGFDVLAQELEHLSPMKPAAVELVKGLARKVYLIVDDRKAKALEQSLLQVVNKYL